MNKVKNGLAVSKIRADISFENLVLHFFVDKARPI